MPPSIYSFDFHSIFCFCFILYIHSFYTFISNLNSFILYFYSILSCLLYFHFIHSFHTIIFSILYLYSIVSFHSFHNLFYALIHSIRLFRNFHSILYFQNSFRAFIHSCLDLLLGLAFFHLLTHLSHTFTHSVIYPFINLDLSCSPLTVTPAANPSSRPWCASFTPNTSRPRLTRSILHLRNPIEPITAFLE